jgi:hypothetical protein
MNVEDFEFHLKKKKISNLPPPSFFLIRHLFWCVNALLSDCEMSSVLYVKLVVV